MQYDFLGGVFKIYTPGIYLFAHKHIRLCKHIGSVGLDCSVWNSDLARPIHALSYKSNKSNVTLIVEVVSLHHSQCILCHNRNTKSLLSLAVNLCFTNTSWYGIQISLVAQLTPLKFEDICVLYRFT